MTETPKNTPYHLMGGEKAVLSLVDRFYFLMDTLPEFSLLRSMHSPTLTQAHDRLFKFLSGWMGGPDLFTPEFGPPFLRRRHLPFAIGPVERDQWMACMNMALNEVSMSADLREFISQRLAQVATHMINQDPF